MGHRTSDISSRAPLAPPPSPPKAPAPGTDGRMIFAKEAAREQWAFLFPPPAMFWTPELADVVKLEKKLPAFLRHERKPMWKQMGRYKRQYFGLVRDGRWIVYGNFFCDAHGKDWLAQPVTVKDGGDCYFQVEYEPKTGRFSNLSVNGEA